MASAHQGRKHLAGRPLTRRTFLRTSIGAAGGALLGRAIGADAAMPSAEADLYERAKKEGKVVWWGAPYSQGVAESVRAAFMVKYPGVEVEFLRQTAHVIYQRVTQDLKVGLHEADVVSVADEPGFFAWKQQGVLASYRPLGVDNLPKDYQNIDPDNTYHVGALGFVLINYNTKVSAPPQKWTDLLDGRWKGQITLGHPGFSGYVGNWVVAMWDQYGWDYFTKLAKNNPKIGRSVNDTVTDIVSGERLVGAGPDNYSLENKARGNPINVQFPADGAILIVSPVGILKDAPHPNAARLFESFYYSKEYSLTMAKTSNYPLRADVAPPSGMPIDKVKWYRNKVERLEKGIPGAIAKWRETFNV